jgi:amino-acid N-acetyltransferase
MHPTRLAFLKAELLACSKGRPLESRWHVAAFRPVLGSNCRYSTESTGSSQQPRKRLHKASRHDQVKEKLQQRQFLESVLATSTTKREAKSFLSRFQLQPVDQSNINAPSPAVSKQPRVNLGTLYSSTLKAVENSPVFSTQASKDNVTTKWDAPLHAAVVKIRDPQLLSDETLSGVAGTLVQLVKLNVLSIVVVDVSEQVLANSDVKSEGRRIVEALHSKSVFGARLVDQCFSFAERDAPSAQADCSKRPELKLQYPSQLLTPLRNGAIPVVAPFAYSETHQNRRVDANEIVLALAAEFATVDILETTKNVSLDRIIFLDPLGGLKDPRDAGRTQIFVNLAHESKAIQHHLQEQLSLCKDTSSSSQYLRTVECLAQCLSRLPPTASALLTTPDEVAEDFSANNGLSLPEVGTRRKRNPLIHNILTDKPLVSSSLPAARLQEHDESSSSRYNTTFFKRGMPITIIPDPAERPWVSGPTTSLRLDADPRIDFSKLVHLIEDSFGRPLDIKHYLDRTKSNIAGIIIAGDYEGGAILTWEQPFNRPGRPPVPYLDKFAVLRRSQGSGGVADIVFTAMVRDCFPNGVVWRSRQSNPVNRWYFERAVGTWQIPQSNWTMFWTGDDLDFSRSSIPDPGERWSDFVSVCENIQPSWADQKPAD